MTLDFCWLSGAEKNCEDSERIVVVLAGGTASGKSTVMQDLVTLLLQDGMVESHRFAAQIAQELHQAKFAPPESIGATGFSKYSAEEFQKYDLLILHYDTVLQSFLFPGQQLPLSKMIFSLLVTLFGLRERKEEPEQAYETHLEALGQTCSRMLVVTLVVPFSEIFRRLKRRSLRRLGRALRFEVSFLRPMRALLWWRYISLPEEGTGVSRYENACDRWLEVVEKKREAMLPE